MRDGIGVLTRINSIVFVDHSEGALVPIRQIGCARRIGVSLSQNDAAS